MFEKGMYPGIATHDVPLVEGSYQLIEKYKLTPQQYEFQMLYGVTPGLRKSIIDKGHRLRVYVPFGEKWFQLPNPAYGSWEGSLYGFDHKLTDDEKRLKKRNFLRTE